MWQQCQKTCSITFHQLPRINVVFEASSAICTRHYLPRVQLQVNEVPTRYASHRPDLPNAGHKAYSDVGSEKVWNLYHAQETLTVR